MTSTITLSIVILNLVLCNLWKTATPAMHTKISTDPEVMKKRYETWLKRHGRHYGNREEWEVRFDIYQSNVQFIEFHNSRNHSYKLTDNRFADLTNEEFKNTYLGFLPRLRVQKNFTYHKHGNLPKSIDWRKKSAVTRVKDQGRCGNLLQFKFIDFLKYTIMRKRNMHRRCKIILHYQPITTIFSAISLHYTPLFYIRW
jgi:C1A family cysteine protease